MSILETKIAREDVVFVLMLLLFLASGSGIGVLQKTIYTLPVALTVLWFFPGNKTFHFPRFAYPFALLLILPFLTIGDFNDEWWRRYYLILVFTSLSILFDMSRMKLSPSLLTWVFLTLFLATKMGLLTETDSKDWNVSVIDSKSVFESTYGFSFALLSVFFFLARNNVMFSINFVLALLAFKRIAIIAAVICVIIAILPRGVAKKLVSPIFVVIIILMATFMIIAFAEGAFDSYIFDIFNRAPNDLFKGRQMLWKTVLEGSNYQLGDFLLYGIGHTKTIDLVTEAYGMRAPLHSDYLVIFLEHGILFFLLFVWLMANQVNFESRLLACFVSILFFTDNVLYYQHVMVLYVILQSILMNQEHVPSQESMPKNPDAQQPLP